MKLENDLGKDPIRKLVLRLAIPSMIAQFVSVFYSIVDRMYIGHIPHIGDLALAGVGVTGPIVTLIGSFALWVGIGGAPLMAIRMGENREYRARQVLANSFVLIFVFAAVTMGLSFYFRETLLLAFGASESTFVYAEEYMRYYLMGTFFAFVASGLNQFIIAQGFAKKGMISVLIGAIANIALDPIFIYGLNLGVKGAALATVLSQFLSASYVLFLLFKKTPIQITFAGYSLDVMKTILKIGFAAFIIIAFDNVLIITLNTLLQFHGGVERGDLLVTSCTIVQSFMLMITMPLGGITGGTQSILSFNYGAKNKERIIDAEKWILTCSLIFTTGMFIVAQTIPHFFVYLFTDNPETIDFCIWAIRVFTLGIIPLGAQYTFVDGFTGMGIVKMSISLSFMRKMLFFICAFIFPLIWDAEAIFFAEPVVDVISGIVTTTIYLKLIHRILVSHFNANSNI